MHHLRTVTSFTLVASFVASSAAAQVSADSGLRVVSTEAGRVAGIAGDVVIFKGIPFARPPVGELRWKPPLPPEPWNDVKPAVEFAPACMQSRDVDKSEDCLYLNLWMPASALGAEEGTPSFPVMVWAFGGSFTGGSGNIDGTALARMGVIVASFNYRVSTFGFLAHPQLTAESPQRASGNYGLQDAVAALRWVRDNIDRFGGDPQRVTLWGYSAGASVITALLVSPAAEGLFQQVILESPGAMRHWKALREAEEQGMMLGSDIQALRQLPASEVPLIENLGGSRGVRALFEPRVIGPVIDGYVLIEEEREAFEAGRMHLVPVLIGNNADEGATFTRQYPITTIDGYRGYLNSPAIFGQFGAEALTHYPVPSDADVPRAISESFGDSQFYFGARGIARAMASNGATVYRYLFSRKSDGGTGHDAWHGAEVRYVRGDVIGPQFNDDDRVLSNTMMDAWVRFVSTGNPNGGAISNWPEYNASTDMHLIIDTRLEIGHGFRNRQLDFIGRVLRATKR